ncbi:MAG: hypothetical protein Q9170_005232 [Blastenia crenularia]
MDEPINLLALDGGGIRGVSMLLVLDEIMRRVQYDKGLTHLPRPCEYFNLIGGTSTGGLIALLLGRLQMTTKDALRTYNKLAEAVFCKANRKSSFKDGSFKATTLEKEVQNLVATKELGESMLYESDDTGLAKTFVCAVPAANLAHPRLFRSYSVRENASTNCKIWEAARATTAAPTFFKRITIVDDGGAQEDFLDGGLGFNNPARLVLEEAMKSFGGASKLGCLVSIGTGHPGTIGLSQPDAFQRILPTEMIGVLKRNATNCEKTAHELAGRFRQSPDRYFRYNVSHGVGSISLEEWKKMNEVQVHTKAYMEEVDVSSSIDKVVKGLCRANEQPQSELSLQSICLVGPAPVTEPTSGTSMKCQPSSSSLFTGRDGFLDALEEFFIDQGPGQHLRREYLLYGMGGAGKTQIALKFAENHPQRQVEADLVFEYDHVLWIDASNRATIEQSYRTEAIKLGTLSDKKISLPEALRQLELYQGTWLLLFDGADNLEEISGLFPPGRYGDIVYTSRNRMLRRLPASQVRQVSEMNHDEALELLLKSARLDVSSTNDQAQASAIVAELGYLALAIDQAGAYIANSECYLEDFLDVFNAHRQHLLGNEAYKGASGSDRAVYATWDLSYAAIDRRIKTGANEASRQGARAALQILRVFPFFHNEGIMEDIFRFAARNSKHHAKTEYEADHGFLPCFLHLHPDGKWDSHGFRQGVQTLLSFSLVGRESSRGHFFMHRLVHIWAYDRLTVAEKERFCYQAQRILKRSITWRFESSDYTFRRFLLPHITTSQRRSSECSVASQKDDLAGFALAFREAGRWKEAEEIEVQVMETDKRELGEEHLHTLDSIARLASIYRDQGRWKEAEELVVQVMEIRKRALGEEHPDTLTSMNNLVSIYLGQGKLKEAEELGVQVTEIRKRVLGEEHPDTLVDINNLALIYRHQGRWEEAEELGVQVLEIQKRVLGEEHPSRLTSMHNLSAIYWSQGRWKEAEELGVQVTEIKKRVLGEEHPSTLDSIANLASTYWNQGRWKKAEELDVQVLEIEKRLLGEEHPSTLISMSNLARTWRSQSRSEEATSLMERCHRLRKQVLGPKHPNTENSLEWLREWQDEDEEAELEDID